MGRLGSFAGGAAKGISQASNIQAQQGQLKLQQQQVQQKEQKQLVDDARKRVDAAVTQSGTIMEQAHQKAALIDDPAEKAQLLDSAKQAVGILQESVTKIDLNIGNDPAVLQSRFATIKESIGITGKQQIAAAGAGVKAGAKAAAVEEAVPTPLSAQSRSAINPKTGEQRQAFFDPSKGKNFFTGTGEEVPPEFNVIPLRAEITGTEAGLTTKATGELETKIIDINSSIANLEQIEQSFDPEFLTLPSQLQIGGLELAEKAGIELSPKNRELVERKATFMQNAIEAINTTIRQITGAQMSELEAKRIRKQVPDPEKDGPTSFKTKLRNAIKSAKLARARHLHMLKNGIQHDFGQESIQPSIGLDQMESILDNRVEEMRNLGLNNVQIRAKLKEEFGI